MGGGGGGGGGGVQVLGFRQARHSSQGSYYMWSIMYMCLHTYRHVETTTQHGKGAKGHRSQLCHYFPSPQGKNSRGGQKLEKNTVKLLISSFHGEWVGG